MLKHIIVLVGCCLASNIAFADGHITGQVKDLNDQPVRDASVVISGANGVEVTVTTDPTGHYQATVPTAGPHSVMFAFGNDRITQKVVVPDGGVAKLDTTLEVGSELIEVHERDRPLKFAKPISDVRAIPPYSDAAALGDRWARAWVLLDVDSRGVVSRVKFIKRPGYDLEPIAVKQAFGLTFDPARDKHGYPAASYVLWTMEWPSLDWLKDNQFTANRLPMLDTLQVAGGVIVQTYPACGAEKGAAAAWNFSDGVHDAHHMGLRDCSIPDMATADATERWIVRDASIPMPVVAPALRIDPVQFRNDQFDALRQARVSSVIAAGAAAAFFAGTIYAYTQYNKWSDRVDADNAPSHVLLAPGQLAHDQKHLQNWELGAVGLAAGATISGLAAAHFWKKAEELGLAIQPGPEGAALSVSGKF